MKSKAANSVALIGDNEKKGFFRRIKDIFNKYGFLGYAALIPAAIFFLIYVARGIHPFGNGTVLVLDLNGQYAYFFEYLREAVTGGDLSLLYSWERALGGEMMGLFAYYIASPLSYIVCLFPKDNLQDALFVMFLIKSSLCGVTMGFYLTKISVKLRKINVVIFSTLYATCSYCVVQMHNTMWIDAVFYLPLIIYGIEQLVKYGKYKLFVTCLALTMISNYYIGYMTCIFVAVYFFFYMFAFSENGKNNPCGEKHHFIRSLVRIGTYSLIGVAIAAVIILGAYYSLGLGKSEFSDPNWALKMNYDLLNVLYKFLPGSYDTVRPVGLPFIFCGVLTLILVPAFFMSKKFTISERIGYALLIIFFMLGFMISTLDLIWHGFQRPNWLNCRFSFMLCFVLVVLAYKVFDRLDKINGSYFIFSAFAICTLVVILQKLADQLKSENEKLVIDDYATLLATLACVAIYLVILAFMKKSKNKEAVATALLCFICVEMFLNGISNLDDLDSDVAFTKYDKYAQYNSLMLPITDTINDSDNGFFRVETTLHRKLCDNMAVNMAGLTNSTSSLNADTIYFLRMMGYSSKSNWSKYLGGTPVNDSLLGLKYIISTRDYDSIYGEPLYTVEEFAAHNGVTVDELIEQTYADNSSGEQYNKLSAEDYVVYKNPYALSLAFNAGSGVVDFNMKQYNTYITESNKNYEKYYNDGGYTSPFTRMNGLITEILGEEEVVEVFKPAYLTSSPALSGCTTALSSDKQHYRYNYTSGVGTITYTYTVPTNTRLFLYIPAYYNREVKIMSSTIEIFDGASTFHGNDTSRIIELGEVNGKGEYATYTLTVPLTTGTSEFYTTNDKSFIYYVDEEVFKDAFSKMQEGQFIADPNCKDHDITGSMTTFNDSQTVLTTIPYDAGWKVFVDGKEVETTEAAGALISFTVDKSGDHDIRFLYRPTLVVLGCAISVCGIIAFALIIIFEGKLKKIKAVKCLYLFEDAICETDEADEDDTADGESAECAGTGSVSENIFARIFRKKDEKQDKRSDKTAGHGKKSERNRKK